MKTINFAILLFAILNTIACAQNPTKTTPPNSGEKIVTASSPADSKLAMQYLDQGSTFYIRHDYQGAIGPYQKALDLVKQGAKLEKTWRRVLIDNLGMSYGISGDLDRAKETFEYGIAKDDEYPLFYYNMACTYGEMDKEDKAIEYLRGAFERKDNMIEGEPFPNPETDSSFKKFMKSEKFLNALAEMKKPKKDK
jgi:tetratricopeptide (TPR) repeat protein